MIKNKFSVLIVILLLSVGCATTGPGGKRDLIIIPESQEIAIGQGMADQILETENLLDDPVWHNYINNLGQKIVSVSDRKNLTYHFAVIESDQVNAFAAPGGFIYFYTGLLKEMDTEAELAAVMAHEISHVVARHSIKRVQSALGVSLAYQLVFGKDGASEALDAAIGVGAGLAFASYSRENEREADQFGLTYMVKAGYNPEGAVAIYRKLAALGSGQESSVFEQLASSHPDTQERIQNAINQIEALKPLPAGLTDNKYMYDQMKARLK